MFIVRMEICVSAQLEVFCFLDILVLIVEEPIGHQLLKHLQWILFSVMKVILQQKKPAFIFVLCFLSLFLCSSLLSMKHTDTVNGIFNQLKLKTKSIKRF